jgi:hypothetical protein
MNDHLELPLVTGIRRRLRELEADLVALASDAPARTSLPVDNAPAPDYSRGISSVPAEMDSESDEEAEQDPMTSLTQNQVREVVEAFEQLLLWKETPNSSMNTDMQNFIDREAMRRLVESMRPLAQVVKACER